MKNMNILFISNDLGAISLACRLAEEGSILKFFERKDHWKEKIRRPGIQFIHDWRKELDWVGKDGLIVFDDTEMGKTQDELRVAGYSVFGGCEAGEKLENERTCGQKIFSLLGMKIKDTKNFFSINEIINFI
jgi:phosphoribosylamine--glycine ligase